MDIKHLLACALLLSACALPSEADLPLDDEQLEHDQSDSDQQDRDPIVGPSAAGGVAVAPGAEPETVPVALEVADCPGAKRLIGILDQGSDCTLGGQLPSEWSGAALFAEGSPGVDALTATLPTAFTEFCAFDYIGEEAQASAEDYDDLFDVIDQSSAISRSTVSADCRGQYEQGDLYDASVGAELRAAFASNIDWDMGLDVDTNYGAREHVEVAVLDTVSQAAADDPQIDPSDEHGLQMAALIREIDCPVDRPNCSDRVRHVMAMPRQDWAAEPDWTVGGHTGTQGDLAMAVYEAVQDWNQRRDAAPSTTASRLIINMSLGWTRFGNLAVDTSRGPAAALLLAMQYASCNGAILVAAAGNTHDELCPHLYPGPLAPASFETTAAPSSSECSILGFTITPEPGRPIFPSGSSYAPLVHAVGALDAFDEPLINARVDGIPRLTALGAYGLTHDGGDSLAGSSVSTAVAAATAAVLWSYRPELTAPEIMQIIYDNGYAIGTDADFSLTGGTVPVHRLSVCAALDAACTGEGGGCPTPGCTATAPASDGYLAGYADAVALILDDVNTTTESFVDASPGSSPTCGTEPEPSLNLIVPQPELPICSRCGMSQPPGEIDGDDEVTMTIDPTYAGQIAAVRLITSDALGTQLFQDFGQAVIDSLNDQPDPVDVTLVFVDRPDATKAALEFTLVSGLSQTNPITITSG